MFPIIFTIFGIVLVLVVIAYTVRSVYRGDIATLSTLYFGGFTLMIVSGQLLMFEFRDHPLIVYGSLSAAFNACTLVAYALRKNSISRSNWGSRMKRCGSVLGNLLRRVCSFGTGSAFLFGSLLCAQTCTGMKSDSMDCGSGMSGYGYCGDGMGGEIVIVGGILLVVTLALLVLGIGLVINAFTKRDQRDQIVAAP